MGRACANRPWGGYKASGIGRDLSRAGLDEYTELKHAYDNFEPKAMGRFRSTSKGSTTLDRRA
ncbi:aldehyde dehydrogenase family protein [Caballeronia sordidicola]|uniref:aldehyde dehydrogenase family protein n=1 Tax=Caballeronia sordidicola TaxID=196367 RepID=UPI00211AD59F|nr:aldehyde dehydrogenase family protein [Caballeronia sordidicola]